jgi:hypothetical protein
MIRTTTSTYTNPFTTPLTYSFNSFTVPGRYVDIEEDVPERKITSLTNVLNDTPDEVADEACNPSLVCPICMTNNRQLVMNCSHTLCVTCVRQDNPRCPECRASIEHAMRFRL